DRRLYLVFDLLERDTEQGRFFFAVNQQFQSIRARFYSQGALDEGGELRVLFHVDQPELTVWDSLALPHRCKSVKPELAERHDLLAGFGNGFWRKLRFRQHHGTRATRF